MSRNQRIALVLAAVLVAVVAFVVVSPGGDDDGDSEQAAQTTTSGGSGEDTTPTEERVIPAVPPDPAPQRIRITGGEVEGGPKTITVEKGDRVRIVVSADAPDDIHLHGYDIEKKAGPGKPARFDFKAKLEGQFEMESHVAEDAGREPTVASLVVEPS
jgi:hypothetical protein